MPAKPTSLAHHISPIKEMLGQYILSNLGKVRVMLEHSAQFTLIDEPESRIGAITNDWVMVKDCHFVIPRIYAGCVLICSTARVTIKNLVCQHLIILGGPEVTIQNVQAETITVLGTTLLKFSNMTLSGTAICLVEQLRFEYGKLLGGERFIAVTDIIGLNQVTLDPNCQYLFGSRQKDRIMKQRSNTYRRHSVTTIGPDSTLTSRLRLSTKAIVQVLNHILDCIPAPLKSLPYWYLQAAHDLGQCPIYDQLQLKSAANAALARWCPSVFDRRNIVAWDNATAWDLLPAVK